MILLHFRLGEFCTRVWFGIAPHLAVDNLRGVAITGRYIRRIFPAERKVIPWNYHPVVVVVHKARDTEVSVVDSGNTEAKEAELVIEDGEEIDLLCGTSSRPKARHATSCSRNDQVGRFSDHQNPGYCD